MSADLKEHYVVHIKVEKVSLVAVKEAGYPKPAVVETKRGVDEVTSLVLKKDTLEGVVNAAKAHLNLVGDE